MPLYDFKCPACNRLAMDVYKSMRSEESLGCPNCGTPMQKIPSCPHTNLKQYHQPIVMHSVSATTEEEIREIQRKCPDVAISDDPSDELYGVPIAKNRKEKMDVLKAVGYVENN